MAERKWRPTVGEMIDRLTILELKHLHNPDHREVIQKEIDDLVHDINLSLPKPASIHAEFIREAIILAQFNTHIWNQEDNARKGDKSNNNLYFTHQANGIRCRAKDRLSKRVSQRTDPKVNAIAAEIPDFEPYWQP